MVTEKKIKEKLKEVEDPHIGLDVVALGFIREIKIEDSEVKIKMVLTSPGCPMAQQILGKVKEAVEELEEVEKTEVELDTEHRWSPEDLSEEAKEEIGHLFK